MNKSLKKGVIYLENNVKYYRRSKGFDLTQQELARKIGVSHVCIVNVESGKTPSLQTAFKLARFFGVKVDDLFFEMNVV